MYGLLHSGGRAASAARMRLSVVVGVSCVVGARSDDVSGNLSGCLHKALSASGILYVMYASMLYLGAAVCKRMARE
jgi:hypothetical protein